MTIPTHYKEYLDGTLSMYEIIDCSFTSPIPSNDQLWHVVLFGVVLAKFDFRNELSSDSPVSPTVNYFEV